ncbi:MAG: hypothetical protein ACO1RX_05505 [Candidatus Sericytochromatia bacterium]
MRISEGSRSPELYQLGIVVHTLTPSSALPEPPTGPSEEWLLSGLQLLDLDRAYLVSPSEKAAIPLPALNQSHLLQALQQMGQRVDLEHALTLHHCAHRLIQDLLSPEQEAPLILRLEGAFGDIELELARLEPDSLRAAFAQGLTQAPEQVAASHQEWASLSHRIRAGFGTESARAVPRLEHWLQAISETPFELARFFEQALGFHPLNEQASVRHLLSELAETVPGEETRETLENRLAERVATLIALADELEATLELAPRPDSPDVSALLQFFLRILEQVQADQAELLRLGQAKEQLDRHLLAQFAERLHRQLRHHQEQLSSLDVSGHARLQVLIEQSLQEVSARNWLTLPGPHPTVTPLWQSLEQRSLL